MSLLYRLCGALVLCLVFAQAQAAEPLGPANERYVELLSNGGPASIRQAARGMHRQHVNDERVLDVAAEVLMRDYKTATGNTEIDALAWITNALAHAETNRYQSVLKEVEANASHRKLAKYAAQNQNSRLPEAEQYSVGEVALEKVAERTADDTPAATARSGDYESLDVVKVGMSRQEVIDLVGHPTATHHHQTGKGFNPFNFRGNDVVREQALYKGQGRVIFSNTSRYANNWEVIEVIIDENESGYP